MEITTRIFNIFQGFCSRKRSRSPGRSENFNSIKRQASKKFNPFISPQNNSLVLRPDSHLPVSPKYFLRTFLNDSKSLNDLEAALVSLKKMKKEAEKSFERLTRTSFKLHENQSVSHCQMTGLEEFLMSHEITEVSAEEIKALCRKVDTKGGDDYFSQIKEFTLNYRDVRMLRKSCWLNDQVINAYISLIKPVANVHVFNTYFFQYVESMGEEIDVNKLKRIIARAGLDSLADKPYVVIPANVFHNHWIVLAINNLNLTIEYYDSKGTRNMEIICAKLERALVQLGIGPYDWEGIDVPYQQNSSDCGIFAAKIVQCLATNSEFLFDADDMKYFRKVMIYELKKAKLL